MTSLGLDFNNSIQLPITLDGLDIINANALNLNVGLGVLQTDTLGDVYGSDTVTCDIIEPRNDYVNFSNNEPAILGVTMTPYIRNAITGSSSIDFNKNTGVISVTGGFASKWGQNGNTIYNINSTGIVAISNLTVTGTETVLGGLEAYTYLNSYATLYSNGSTRLNGSLIVTGGSTFNGNLRIISGGMSITGNVTMNNGLFVSGNGVTMNTGLSVSGGISVTGSSTFNQNVTVNGGIGIGQAPFGGVHRLNTKGRIRATAFDATDSSGVIETVSNMGYINYLYTADNNKSYYDGTSANLNIQIGLSANAGLEVNGGSVHNSGIYVVGGSEINGGLQIQDGLNVSGAFGASFNNGLLITGNVLEAYQGLFITGGSVLKGRVSVSGNMTVSGTADFANQRVVISNTGTYTSVGDIRLGRTPNSLTEGRLLTISFGTGTAGPTTQGILFADATTPFDTGIYGGQQQLYFNAGGSQRMSIGANVDFTSIPYVGGNPIDTDDVQEGLTRLYYTDARFDTRFATKTTTNLTEGTNLYFTTARARQSISASSPLSYNNSTGVLSLPSGHFAKEWSRRVNNSANASITYYKIANLSNNAGGDGSIYLQGTLGGWEANTQCSFEFAVGTRSSRLVWGSLNSSSFSVANLIGRMDFLLYQNASLTFDLYMVLKANTYQAFDFTVQYCDNPNFIIYNPTTTPDTAPSGGSDAITSILGSLNTYTIGGNVAMGWSGANTNKLLVSGNASVQNLFVRSSSLTTNGTDLFINAGTTNELIHIRPNGNGSSVGQSKFNPTSTSLQADALIINSSSRVGIGNLNPQFLLSLSANTDTTAHIKSNSTTGIAELFLQADNASAGGGMYLNGSNSYVGIGKPNTLNIQNEVGDIFVGAPAGNKVYVNNSLTVSGNMNIGRNDTSIYDSSLLVSGRDYRTDGTIAGIHMGYSANGFGPALGLVSTTTGNSNIFFSHRTDLGVTAAGSIAFNSNSAQMDLGAKIFTFNTNTNIASVSPYIERMRILADGTVLIGDNVGRTSFTTYASGVEQLLGRLAIKGYSSSDQNPVIMFQEWNGGANSGREHYFYVDGANGFRMATSSGAVPRLGINIAPAYQIQLSIDSAGKPTSNGWTIVSDRRLKENIEDANLNICYENMKKLKLKRFNYKEEWMVDENGNRKSLDTKFLGFIAQEVQQVFPKAITIIDDSSNSGIEDLHTLDTDQIMKSMYGALQKLIDKVENLEEVIIKERIQYKGMKQIQDGIIRKHEQLLTKQGILIDSMKKALLLKGISIN